MWLLPVFSQVAAAALRTFYRLRISGSRVPREGPVLLVANHPNSLLDPALVVAAAGRPVRFLAKAPLFSDPQVGWLVRAAGAVPVYRRADDPQQMDRNDDTFRAVEGALLEGAAVGIFPEGLSHSAPALAPLKTGAARIALGAAERRGGEVPVVPVGLSFRAKERFRSEALVVIGEPVPWADLAGAGRAPEAVRELTARIDAALRQVTVNLERWEDAPLVEYAEEIYAAERRVDADPARRVARLREVSESLARLRAGQRAEWTPLAAEVARHARILRRLGLRPHQLGRPAPVAVARWVARHLAFFLLGAPLAALGTVVFAPPYHLTGLLERHSGRETDVRASYKLLVGGLVHLAWVALLALTVLLWLGPLHALAALFVLPALGMVTVRFMDRWRAARDEVRRFVVRTRRAELIRELQLRQAEIASRLEQLRLRLSPPPAASVTPSGARL